VLRVATAAECRMIPNSVSLDVWSAAGSSVAIMSKRDSVRIDDIQTGAQNFTPQNISYVNRKSDHSLIYILPKHPKTNPLSAIALSSSHFVGRVDFHGLSPLLRAWILSSGGRRGESPMQQVSHIRRSRRFSCFPRRPNYDSTATCHSRIVFSIPRAVAAGRFPTSDGDRTRPTT